MAHVTQDQLVSFFQRYGWQFDVLGQGQLESGWQGERQFYPLSVQLTSVSVIFTVRPFLTVDLLSSWDTGESWGVWPALLREVLDLNAQLKLVNMTATKTGELSLGCQVLAAGFSYASFARILEVLGYYADVLFDEISPRISARGSKTTPRHSPQLLS